MFVIGFNYAVARNEEYQRALANGRVSPSSNSPIESSQKAGSPLAKGQPIQLNGAAGSKIGASSLTKGLANGSTHEDSQLVSSGTGQTNSSSNTAAFGPALVTPVKDKTSLGGKIRGNGALKQQMLPDKIDFVLVNGANGFVYLEETSGTRQRLELPEKDTMANLTIKTKPRFQPLTFRAIMKDSSQQLYVNGKEELDVASEALSPYWLIVHSKGACHNSFLEFNL